MADTHLGASRYYMVSGYSGQAGGRTLHRFKVCARNATEAKRRISRSTLATAWDGAAIRRFEAERWQPWHEGIGGVRVVDA